MKVKCKKFLSPLADRAELDSCTYLTKGKEYIVLGISFSTRSQHVYMEDDYGKPGFSDIKQFDVTSSFIPSSWVASYKEKFDLLEFWPKAWIESDNFREKSFWERLVDDEPETIALYEKERDLIYQEEPRGGDDGGKLYSSSGLH